MLYARAAPNALQCDERGHMPNRQTRTKAILREVLNELSNGDTVYVEMAVERVMLALFPASNPNSQAAMVGAVCRAMQLEPELNGDRVGKLASALLNAGYTSEQIDAWYKLELSSPWGLNWRSAHGSQPPSERAIRETVYQFAHENGKDSILEYPE